MKQVFTLAISLMIFFASEAQLWTEDFLDEANGAQVGTAGGTLGGTWSVDIDPSGTFAVQDNVFTINNTVTEGTWSSDVIDISTVGYAVIDIGYGSFGLGFSNSDYIRFYYRIDSGPEILFANIQGDVWAIGEAEASAIVAGNTLEVIIKAEDNSSFFFLSGLMWISDVTVTAAPIIYSRKSGTWTDVSGGVGGSGTWSLTGHTGPACGCYPLNTQVAIVGSGHTVTLPSSQTNIGNPPTTNLAPGAVDVYGTLLYNTNGVSLGVQQGLFRTRNGGVVNSSSGAITGEQISFQADVGGATFRVDAGGSVAIEDLALTAAATNYHFLIGSGTLTITDDILLGATDATLTNDRTASFSIGDDFEFNARSSFVNNGTVTIGDDILVDNDDVSIANNSSAILSIGDNLSFNAADGTFTNSGTTTITGDLRTANNTNDDNIVTNNGGAILTLNDINPNDADMDVYNSGTINQSGNFLNITSTDSNFDNLSTGTWNWTMASNTLDPQLAAAMNLTAAGNIFNYGAAGMQNIVASTHHHISLTNSGVKTASGSFAVQGDFEVSGTASFAAGTTTVTLNGSVAQSLNLTASGITFYSLNINNSFGASPQITVNSASVTVTAVLDMDDGTVNLNGNTFSLTSTAAGALIHSLASTSGWMYGGSFARARPGATTINIGVAHSLFPLGSASDWRPFFAGQNNVAATAGTMTVSHTNATSTSDVSFAESIVRRHDSYWTPTTTASGGTYTLRAGGTNFGTITSSAHLRMSTSTGVVGTHAAGSGGPTDWRVNRTAITRAQLNANNFHVASTNAANSPLPIELLSFSAQLKNNEVELKWSTASETNNDYFTIERATDLERFEAVIKEDGKGTTKELTHYKATDGTPLYGRSYYRLKQTDFDGKYSYSSLQVIDYEGPVYATLSASPNPLTGTPLTIKIEGLKETTHVPVRILNVHGQLVYDKIFEVKTPGTLTEQIPSHHFLTSGLYIIKAGETLYLTQKLVVE